MERCTVAETDPMPSLVVDYTELGCGKLKICNSFPEPNFETVTKHRQFLQLRRVGSPYFSMTI